MSGKTNITFNIKMNVDGKESVVQMGVETAKLAEVFDMAAKRSEKALGTMKQWSDLTYVTSALQNVNSALQQVSAITKDFTAAYEAQIQAETQLAQMMRNTMDATEESIQSIKDYCSAQQQIGVVGDEVQLAGAQKLAAF